MFYIQSEQPERRMMERKYTLFRPCKEPVCFFFTEHDNSRVLLQHCELAHGLRNSAE